LLFNNFVTSQHRGHLKHNFQTTFVVTCSTTATPTTHWATWSTASCPTARTNCGYTDKDWPTDYRKPQCKSSKGIFWWPDWTGS